MYTFRHTAVFNIVGMIVLLIGIGSASRVYRRAQPVPSAAAPGDWQDSSLPLMDSKNSTRTIELYGGKVEVLMVKVLEWGQRPATQALLIATSALLIAAGCFMVARHLSDNPVRRCR